jgi:plastocyanin
MNTRVMSGIRFALFLGCAAVCAGAAPAQAAVERVTVRQGPLALDPYEVGFASAKTRRVRAPRLDGWIVKMHARVVDGRGRPMPVRRVMLHHVVYKNAARRDEVCGGAQSFYGTGEENQTLRLPPGYGYRVRRGDRWRTGWMLMNHRNRRQAAYIEYTAWIETSERLRSVVPYWVRATGCEYRNDPIFNVPGGGAPGSTFAKSSWWTVPRTGRLVAGGSHVHGGAKELALTRPACPDGRLMSSRPLFGLPDHPYYNVLPVLHEPGPFATSWLTSATGVPVERGEQLRVTAVYDGERPHTRVMGIWHLYLAPDAQARATCGPPPADLRDELPPEPGRTDPPAVTVPLTGLDGRGAARTILRPPGPLVRAGARATVRVGSRTYGIRNLSIALGGVVRWRFTASREYHDVTLANGPVGFASRWSVRGRNYARRFDVPGTYRLFCSLHPIDMTQVVTVRPR